MIDPRFANAGAVPLVPGFGAQQLPVHYHYHHRHHHHHKNKPRHDESPVSRDESIHKVDQNQYNFQNKDMPLGTGYGVPFGGNNFGPASQQQFKANTYGYTNQYQNGPFGQYPTPGAPGNQSLKRHKHHRRRHAAEIANNGAPEEQEHAVPDPIVGQRSSSVVAEERQENQPTELTAENLNNNNNRNSGRRHRHRHRHRNQGENVSYGQTTQQNQNRCHTTSVGADGYGHINDDLIFIERGHHSPHRQAPPPGFEYKGKIEVQGMNREIRSRSRGPITIAPPVAPVQPTAPPTTTTTGLCPPGWQPVVLPASGVTSALSYPTQAMGGFGAVSTGMGGFGTVGSYGLTGTTGGYVNPTAGLSYPSQCQLVADYVFGSNTAAVNTTGINRFCTTTYQQPAVTGVVETLANEKVEELVSERPTIIEVWQRRSTAKTDNIEKSSSSKERIRTTMPTTSTFNFDEFRSDILRAIERMITRGPTTQSEIHSTVTGRDGGTQTQLHPSTGGETRSKRETRQESNNGEVRVVVQPIQPVFYMPQQSVTTKPDGTPQFTPLSATQQSSGGAPNVVYVPRNVYVPVIKPVFVPRERVIVRPQVIHVARPVLVDRPVPVTQRPIIIDRERPIPVPVRGGTQDVAQTSDSKVVREEYVYRDNLPVAYGGRCPEFAGGVNYGYMPTEQEHQYASSSMHEASNIFQRQAPDINVNVTNQYQHSQSASHFEGQEAVCADFHGSYSNIAGADGPFATAGMNNDYLTTAQDQQYAAANSIHETTNIYQTEGQVINVNVPDQYQHSQSASQLDIHQDNANVADEHAHIYHASYSNLVGANCTEPFRIDQPNQEVIRQTFEQTAQTTGVSVNCPTQIEILDTAVNPFWQKTDPSTLVRRYGRPAYEIVHKSEEIEQQMYNELRQRASTSEVIRSASTASYGSGSGIGVGGNGVVQY